MNEIAELAQRISEFRTAVNDIKKELNDLYTTMKIQANAKIAGLAYRQRRKKTFSKKASRKRRRL
tara:strand:- start:1249 stop:1443 length:195 start_codon:yes stop_codon:yes gene_type:complete